MRSVDIPEQDVLEFLKKYVALGPKERITGLSAQPGFPSRIYKATVDHHFTPREQYEQIKTDYLEKTK